MSKLLEILFRVVIIVGLIFYQAYALKLSWNWVFVQIFNLPNLNIYGAIGVVAIIGYLTECYQTPLKEDEVKKIWKIVLNPALIVFICYLVKDYI